jgi:hypothetical protein
MTASSIHEPHCWNGKLGLSLKVKSHAFAFVSCVSQLIEACFEGVKLAQKATCCQEVTVWSQEAC